MNWKLFFAVVLSIIGLVMVISSVVMFINKHNVISSWILMIFGIMFFLFGIAGFVWSIVQDAEIVISGGKLNIGSTELVVERDGAYIDNKRSDDYREGCTKSETCTRSSNEKKCSIELPDIKPVKPQCYETKCYIPDPITIKLPDLVIQPSPVKVEQPCYTSTSSVCGGKLDHKIDTGYSSSSGTKQQGTILAPPPSTVQSVAVAPTTSSSSSQQQQQQYQYTNKVPDFPPVDTTTKRASSGIVAPGPIPFTRQQQPTTNTTAPFTTTSSSDAPKLSTSLYSNVPSKVVATAPSNSPGIVTIMRK